MEQATFALLLEQTDGAEPTYRRVGIAQMPDESITESDWEMKTATII